MTVLNMFNLISSNYLKKNLVYIFFVVCFISVLFQFSLFAQTRNIIANSFVNNIFEPSLDTNSDLNHLQGTEETSFISKYEAFPSLANSKTTNQFYVAPNGNSSGNGSINNPWDLKTVLSHPSAVSPGAIIWLRGGIYKIPLGLLGFTSALTGTPENPIKVLSYPGEWAVIDGNSVIEIVTILRIFGAYTWFMNFEITDTETSRRIMATPPLSTTNRRITSVSDYGIGTKIINLVIHDTGQGIGAWQQGRDNEYYGNIVYNNGWDAPDRGHGHGTYVQNANGYKTFEDNIFFNQFGVNSKTGGTDAASVRNISWIGNVFFNGKMSWTGPNIENLSVLGNYTYNNPFKVGNEVTTTYTTAEVRDNYFMTGVQLFEFTENINFKNNTIWDSGGMNRNLVINIKKILTPEKVSIDNNTYYKSVHLFPYWQFKINYYGNEEKVPAIPTYGGYYAFNKIIGSQQQTFSYTKRSWQDDLQIDQNSTYIDSVPNRTQVFVKPNKYDSNRSHIIIYNWGQTDTVNVNVKPILRPGDSYELRNVQDYFGDVVSGTYRGGKLRISMNGRTRAKPIGYDQVSSWYHDPLQPNTFPTFGVFVLIKTNRN